VRKDLLGLLRARRGQSAIVYCMSRRSVESTAEYLATHGVSAAPYHAGLSDNVRARHQDAFARDDIDVIVATVAFGMGIDKSNVRIVVHRDMPKSVEAWVQEIGRAGRDGLPSECVVYYSWADVIGYDTFLDSIDDAELKAETRHKTIELFRLLDGSGCRHRAACAYFDEALEPCGSSCDACSGQGIEALVSAAGARGATAGGDGRAVRSTSMAELREARSGSRGAVRDAARRAQATRRRRGRARLHRLQRRRAPRHGGAPPALGGRTAPGPGRGTGEARALRRGVPRGAAPGVSALDARAPLALSSPLP
jgi:superfamily II DNA/RNA helicase